MTTLDEGYFFEPGPIKINGVPTSMAMDLAQAAKAEGVSFHTFCRRALCAAMGRPRSGTTWR